MALRFMDGFDHYPSAEIGSKWNTPSSSITFVGGRFGGSALSTNQRTVVKTLDAQPTWIFGFAIAFGSVNGPLLKIINGGTTQGDLFWDPATERLTVRRAGTTTLGTSARQFKTNVWYYCELKYTISDTVGVVHLRMDEQDEINLTGQDTLNSGSTADRFQFGDGGVSNISVSIDDLYVLDGTGSAPYNDFLGDCRIETLLPSANGTTSNLVGQDANSTDNYLNVDETNSDDDTTYNESSTPGDKDTYNYPSLATTSGTVHAVGIYPWARKTDAGARSMCTVARDSTTETDGTTIPLPSTYTYITQDLRTAKPSGGAWTIAEVNGAEFGVKVVA
jgi:hypothetical protein